MVKLLSSIILFCVLILGLFHCSTGSSYERLKQQSSQNLKNEASLSGAEKLQIAVGKFDFTEQPSHQELFAKGFFLPGYIGVDTESKGRFNSTTAANGVKNIYDVTDYSQRLEKFLLAKGVNSADPNSKTAIQLSGNFTATETASRLHTYGCWPLVGTFIYLFNGKYVTFVNQTTVTYSIAYPDKPVKTGVLNITTEESLGFYRNLGNLDGKMLPNLMGATEKHLNEIHSRLLQAVLEGY